MNGTQAPKIEVGDLAVEHGGLPMTVVLAEPDADGDIVVQYPRPDGQWEYQLARLNDVVLAVPEAWVKLYLKDDEDGPAYELGAPWKTRLEAEQAGSGASGTLVGLLHIWPSGAIEVVS